MSDPTFVLKGVVRSRDETEDFEGPLSVILQLLSKNKIEIRDLRISDLLDQYLAWIDEQKSMDLDIASEFVAMASHLVYIKARMLINEGEEPEELDELRRSLEILRRREEQTRIKAVTGTLADMYRSGSGTFVRQPEPAPELRDYRYSHPPSALVRALIRAFGRAEDIEEALRTPVVSMPSPIIYPVDKKAEEIIFLLKRRGYESVHTLLTECRSRTEMVATFIALLELCSTGGISLEDEGENVIVRPMSGTERRDDNG